MLQSSRTASTLSLTPLMVQRRRALIVAPPAAAVAMPMGEGAAEAQGSDWRADLQFFLACYAAGLLFFLVMLS